MRKLLTFLTTLTAAVAVIVLFTACEQFLKDPEDFLSYWASEAFVKDHSISSEPRPDGAGVPCVGSSVPVYIMLTVHNPKGFSFVLPTASEPAGIVEFKDLSLQPEVETHYDLERTAPGRLKLTYKKAFLQKYEQGSGSLNPTITLKATDGRVFKKTYTFGIKSNTPPPKPAVVLAKQTNASSNYYVLCIDTNDLGALSAFVNGKYIHDDIAYVTVNGTRYNLKMNDAHNGFSEKPTAPSFLADGTGLMAVGSAQLPEASPWVLYYKTNIEIGPGNPETSYTITLIDKGGVVSDEAFAEIEPSGPTHTVTFSVENPTGGTLKATPEGGSENTTGSVLVEHGKNVTFNANPNEGYKVEKWTVDGSPVNGTNKTYTLYNIIDDKTVTVKFKKVYTVKFRVVDGEGGILKGSYGGHTKIANYNNDGSEQMFTNVSNGDTVSFEATPYPGWKVKAWTLDGYNVSGEQENYGTPPITGNKIVTVEFERVTTIENGNNFAWKLLKNAVKVAVDGTTITIKGEIKASGPYEEDWGEIEITKHLTIEGKTGAGTDILDANKMSRIFKVENGANLILKNLTLTGGKATGTGDAGSGGAIYAKNASTVNIENCIITGNEADTNGGGIYVEGTPTTITNCIFTGNTAKNGGGIYIIQGDRIPVVTISGGTIGGTGTGEANKATGSDGNGGGIYVGDRCKVILQNNDSTGCTIKGNTAQLGGGVYAANKADVSMKGGTQIAVDNDVYLYSGSAILVYNALATAGTVARITVPKDDYKTSTKVLYGDAVGSEHAKFAVTPKGSEHWTVDSNGYLTNNKTDIFNNITKDQIKAAIDAASSMIYGEGATIDHMALDGKLVLYMTGKRDYGIMHVTNVNNSGGGYIKFNYKTFRTYDSDVLQENDKVVNGGKSFDLDSGGSGSSGNDFSLKNTGQKRFKVLDNAKFYILPN
mgnify:FL=1